MNNYLFTLVHQNVFNEFRITWNRLKDEFYYVIIAKNAQCDDYCPRHLYKLKARYQTPNELHQCSTLYPLLYPVWTINHGWIDSQHWILKCCQDVENTTSSIPDCQANLGLCSEPSFNVFTRSERLTNAAERCLTNQRQLKPDNASTMQQNPVDERWIKQVVTRTVFISFVWIKKISGCTRTNGRTDLQTVSVLEKSYVVCLVEFHEYKPLQASPNNWTQPNQTGCMRSRP